MSDDYDFFIKRIFRGINRPAVFGTLEEELFYRVLDGEIPLGEYFLGNATLVAEKTQLHGPTPYLELPSPIWNYVEGRMQGRQEWESFGAKKLSEWVISHCHRTLENEQSLRVLHWAHEKIESYWKKIPDRNENVPPPELASLKSAIARFDRLKPLEPEKLQQCLDCIGRDMAERPRKAG